MSVSPLMESIMRNAGLYEATASKDEVLKTVAKGKRKAKDVVDNPKTEAERAAAKELEKMANEIAAKHHYNVDEDRDAICCKIKADLCKRFGYESDEKKETSEVVKEAMKFAGIYVAERFASSDDHPVATYGELEGDEADFSDEDPDAALADIAIKAKSSCSDKERRARLDAEKEARAIDAELSLDSIREGEEQLTEWEDDEDDEVRRAEQEIERQKKSDKKAAKAWAAADYEASKADADKDLEEIRPKKEKKEDSKEEPVEEPVEKKEETKAPAARGAFTKIAREMLQKGATATEIKKALQDAGIEVKHLHSRLHSVRKSLKEAYVLTHPASPSYILVDNYQMGTHDWVLDEEIVVGMEPAVYESLEEAQEAVRRFSEYSRQDAVIAELML